VTACTGGALEKSLNQFVIEGDLAVHHLFENEHLAPGIVRRSQGGPIHRANGLAETAARTLKNLFPVFFHKIVFDFHFSPSSK
jgi:hypothetical protein